MQSKRDDYGFPSFLEDCPAVWPCPTCRGQAEVELIKELEILIVAEDLEFAKAMGAILQEQGYQIYLAPDVETALEELDNYSIDLLIVQPGRDDLANLDAALKVKQGEAPVKVMVISGPRGKMFPVEAFELEVDDYLIFPFSTAELGRRVASLLGPGLPDLGDFPAQSPAERINARTLASLRLLMGEIRSTLVKANASLQTVNRSEYGPLNKEGAAKINEILHHISRTIGLAEGFHRKTLHLSG
jgi:DNA-binding response OmpR family regulator